MMGFVEMEVDLSSPMEANGDNSDHVNNNGTVPEESRTADGKEASSAQLQTSTSSVGGPRLAPAYSVVNAILEKKEDGPGPRCGHALTAVAAVGEEGTPNYIGPRLILFGGATALEGNSTNAGTPTSAGGAGIHVNYMETC